MRGEGSNYVATLETWGPKEGYFGGLLGEVTDCLCLDFSLKPPEYRGSMVLSFRLAIDGDLLEQSWELRQREHIPFLYHLPVGCCLVS